MTTKITPKQQERLDELGKIVQEQFGVTDKYGSYIYHLNRDKEAFQIGTMTLDDFTEIEADDEWLVELESKIKDHILKSMQIAVQEEREKAITKVKDQIKRWHIRYEQTSDPEVNAERKEFNDEVTVLINSVLIDVVNSLTTEE